MLNLKHRQFFLKSYGILLFDLAMAAMAIWSAFYLRIGNDFLNYPTDFHLQHTGLFTGVALVVMSFYGLSKYIWSYTSLKEVSTILKIATLTVAIYAIALFFWTRMEGFPRSSLVIGWFIMAALLGGPRILYRAYRDRNFRKVLSTTPQRQVPIFLVGAGDGSEVFIRELNRMRNAPYKVVGIVDDKGSRVGRQIRGHTVIGQLKDLEELLTLYKQKRIQAPQRLIITKKSIDGATIRQIVQTADEFGISVRRLPELTQFSDMDPRKIQPRKIEIEDLLGRAQARLDKQGIKALIEGKKVIVTGAGGTIGSELCRQIAQLNPKKMAILDSSEFNLYQIDYELRKSNPDLFLDAQMADVRNQNRINDLFASFKPHVVFHAAALKHVPIVESNPVEGISTNVLGSKTVADACVTHKVKSMVMVSTDKAVNPTSIMGTTKRLAEAYCQALDTAQTTTNFVTVRFGNVLGSTGSVVPLFQQQIADGGPITVTHPDMQRYFMSTREAVELIIQSAVKAKGKDTRSKIFVLDMGAPVKIVDLARQMIILAGLKPEEDISIEYTGIREGEKLFEELFHEKEALVKTEHKQIYLAEPRHAELKALESKLKKLSKFCEQQNAQDAITLLLSLVPEYITSDKELPNSKKTGT